MAKKREEVILHKYTEEENEAIEKIAKIKDSAKRNDTLRIYAEKSGIPYKNLYQKVRKDWKKTRAKKVGNPIQQRPHQRKNHVPHRPGTPLMVSQTEIRFNIVGMEFRKLKTGGTEFVIKL